MNRSGNKYSLTADEIRGIKEEAENAKLFLNSDFLDSIFEKVVETVRNTQYQLIADKSEELFDALNESIESTKGSLQTKIDNNDTFFDEIVVKLQFGNETHREIKDLQNEIMYMIYTHNYDYGRFTYLLESAVDYDPAKLDELIDFLSQKEKELKYFIESFFMNVKRKKLDNRFYPALGELFKPILSVYVEFIKKCKREYEELRDSINKAPSNMVTGITPQSTKSSKSNVERATSKSENDFSDIPGLGDSQAGVPKSFGNKPNNQSRQKQRFEVLLESSGFTKDEIEEMKEDKLTFFDVNIFCPSNKYTQVGEWVEEKDKSPKIHSPKIHMPTVKYLEKDKYGNALPTSLFDMAYTMFSSNCPSYNNTTINNQLKNRTLKVWLEANVNSMFNRDAITYNYKTYNNNYKSKVILEGLYPDETTILIRMILGRASYFPVSMNTTILMLDNAAVDEYNKNYD